MFVVSHHCCNITYNFIFPRVFRTDENVKLESTFVTLFENWKLSSL